MQVIGSAQEARALEKGIQVRAQSIAELTQDIGGKLNALGGSYRDSGYAELQEIVGKVVKSILSHKDDINNVRAGLKEYADVLESGN